MTNMDIMMEKCAGFNTRVLIQYDFNPTMYLILIDIGIERKKWKNSNFIFSILFCGWPSNFEYRVDEWPTWVSHYAKWSKGIGWLEGSQINYGLVTKECNHQK